MIKKAVILAAGKGSRMNPITKVVPKPMLQILTKPALDYIIDECVEAGIEEICMIVGHQKQMIKEYFRDNENISFIDQRELSGTAGALEEAKSFINNEPFALLFGDEVVDSKTPLLKEMVSLYKEKELPFIGAVDEAPFEKIKEYNSVSFNPVDKNVISITTIHEKPDFTPSHSFTVIGRFIFSPEIFTYLKDVEKNANGERYLTDTLHVFAKENRFFGYLFDGKRFDIGYEKGWLETNIHFSKKTL